MSAVVSCFGKRHRRFFKAVRIATSSLQNVRAISSRTSSSECDKTFNGRFKSPSTLSCLLRSNRYKLCAQDSLQKKVPTLASKAYGVAPTHICIYFNDTRCVRMAVYSSSGSVLIPASTVVHWHIPFIHRKGRFLPFLVLHRPVSYTHLTLPTIYSV